MIERATGRRYADLVSDLLWQPVGAACDAYITVDRFGAPRSAGGICATTLDLARLGQIVARNGRNGDVQVIPERWIADIVEQSDRAAWDGGDLKEFFGSRPVHYRSKWYVENGEMPLIFALGVHGQNLFVDQANDIVISKFSAQRKALDGDTIDLTFSLVHAIWPKFLSS